MPEQENDDSLEPDDPWGMDPESPNSPMFPYGNDSEVVTALWFIEVIRRLQAGGPSAYSDQYASDMNCMIQIHVNGFCQVIEDHLDWLHQVSQRLETRDPSSIQTPAPPPTPFPYGIDREIASAGWFLEVIRRIHMAGAVANNDRYIPDMKAMILSYLEDFRHVIEQDLAFRKDLFHEQDRQDRREEAEAVYTLRRDVDLFETRCREPDQPHPHEDDH